MTDDHKSSDIQDVIKEESRRCKRRVDTKALELTQHRPKMLRESLTNSKMEREIAEAIREMKLADDPEQLRELLKIWRASF
jgi:hypothetical protein